ncbi:DKNYY domain-containing protein [Stenotrophomonas sp. TWI700]|uniref:DKNYY domain-containing protein n=1 Tax=Stenotrophomonas sp. TWI700 TaxID=3136792 RepID=UPI00320B2192
MLLMVFRPIFGFVAWQEPQYCLHHGFSTRQAPLRMDLQLVTDRSRYTLARPVIRFQQLDIGLGHYDFYVDGRRVETTVGQPREYELRLLDFRDRIGECFLVDLHITYRPGGRSEGAERTAVASNTVTLELDLRDIKILTTASGIASQYLEYQGQVYFISADREGRKQWRLQADATSAKALQGLSKGQCYLRDHAAVFSDGRALKGLNPETFSILNGIFASDGKTVITLYGNAKVTDPQSFVVLDDGHQDITDNECVISGYARDKANGYWFTNSTSSKHAMVIRACKQPASLESLGNGFARDCDHVYLEGVRIPAADPQTWQRINRLYSRDAKHVFYLTRKLEADPDTFQALESFDPLESSYWGRDRTNYYCRWEVTNCENYQRDVHEAPNRPQMAIEGTDEC